MMKYLLAIIVCCSCSLSYSQDQPVDSTPSRLSPDPRRLEALESNPDEHPVVILRLLKYRDGVGPESYREFSAVAVPRIRELGGEVVFHGTARPIGAEDFERTNLFGWRPNPWDEIVLERYPSRRDFRRLDESEAYRAAAMQLRDSLEDVVLYALNGTRLSTGGREPGIAEINVAADHPDRAVFMLNLLEFKPGGEEIYLRDYGRPVTHLIQDKYHGKVIYGLQPEQILVGDEEYDRVILVMYPSVADFTTMIQSDEYQRVSHYRTDAVEIGHLFAFTQRPTTPEGLREQK